MQATQLRVKVVELPSSWNIHEEELSADKMSLFLVRSKKEVAK